MIFEGRFSMTDRVDFYWFRDPRIFLPRGASSWLLFLRELLHVC